MEAVDQKVGAQKIGERVGVEIVNVTQRAFAFLDIPFTFVCLI